MRLPSALVCLAALALAGCVMPRGPAPQGAAPVRAAVPAVASTLSAKGVANCQAEIGDVLAGNFQGRVEISVLTPESAQGAGSIAIIPVADSHPRITMLTYAPSASAGGACDVQAIVATAIGAGCGSLPAKLMSDSKIRTLHGKDLLQGGRTPTEGVLLKDIGGKQCLSLALNASGPPLGAASSVAAGDRSGETLRRAGVSRCTAEIAGVVTANVAGAAQVAVLASDASAGSGAVAFWPEGEYHPKIHLLSYFERPGGACALKMTTVSALSGACTALPASLLQGGAITQRFGADLMQGKAGTARNFMFKDFGGQSCVAFDFL
jgi:hypothetical protein